MASNPTTRHELVAEIRAHAEASMIVKLLGDYCNGSGKQFTRSRPLRLERWLQLANCAREEANGLLALDRTPRRAAKPAGKAVPTACDAPSAPATNVA